MAAAPQLSETASAICIAFLALVPLAGAALALMNSGLGRSRSAAHAVMTSLCAMAVAALVYFVLGSSFDTYPGRPSHELSIGGKPWSWLGAGPLFLRGIEEEGAGAALAAWLKMMGVALAALIPLGAGLDRWRLSAGCASTAILAGWTYPLFAHWAWGGGWLARLGVNYGLGRGFLDAGGAGTIQALGGLTALSILWILGPRRGKFAMDGMPAAIPGHNAVLVLFACVLASVGWLGLNGAGAILFAGASSAPVLIVVGINTFLAACSAFLTAVAITRSRFSKPDASLCANAWVAGLVAISAGCASTHPAGAVVTGGIAGALVIFTIEWFELHLGLDDPCGSIAVHAIGGIWGLLAAGLFAREEGQWAAQLVGVATLLGFVLPLTYGLNWLLNRFHPQRVHAEGERQGLDLYELGAGAYPEFVVRGEEFLPR